MGRPSISRHAARLRRCRAAAMKRSRCSRFWAASACAGPAVARTAVAGRASARFRAERHGGVRRLVCESRRHVQHSVRIFQSQFQRRAGYSDRTGESHRAGRSGPGPAHALPDAPAVGRIHRHRAQGFRREEAHLDADGEWEDHADSGWPGYARGSCLRSRTRPTTHRRYRVSRRPVHSCRVRAGSARRLRPAVQTPMPLSRVGGRRRERDSGSDPAQDARGGAFLEQVSRAGNGHLRAAISPRSRMPT